MDKLPPSVECHLCKTEMATNEADIQRKDIFGSSEQNNDSTTVCLLMCQHCHKDVMIFLKDKWMHIDEALQQPDVSDGIYQVKDYSERVTLYILNQICYNQYDIDAELEESPFSCHSTNELAWLTWKNGEAVGFYTIKNKGDQLYDMPYCRYNLTMLDTIYIRPHVRHQGLGTELVRHFLDQHSEEDVGFSSPLSYKLLTVLHRILLMDVKLRDHIWECSYDGSEGYRRNVWLHCKLIFKVN